MELGTNGNILKSPI